ncbi:MAG: endospore germination permease [Halanaerobiales bacterium]|nr:endospore germination permease [Halanaerobiales bacterium]
MKREVISDRQGIYLITLFIMGSTLILGTAAQAEKDIWLAILLAMVFAFPTLSMYARLHALFPGKDLYDILEFVFGRYLGKIISFVYIWFAFHLGTLVLRNFGEFLTTVGLLDTPTALLYVIMILLCLWAVKEGIEVLGRWGEFFIKIIIPLILLTIILGIPDMTINNIRPVFYNGIKPILDGAFSTYTFPLAETVIFMMVLSPLKEENSSYKIYWVGLLIGGFIIFISAFFEILVLGVNLYSESYFPAYIAVSRINIGDFLQRMEIIVSITFLIGGFIKISICLLAASKGIGKVFGFDDYRILATPVALLMVNLAYFIYDSIMEMTEWTFKIWNMYAFPFQVILPILILIAAEIKVRRKRRE